MATRTDTVEDGRGNVISSVTRQNPPEFDNREAMLGKAQQALTANATDRAESEAFLAIATPTNPQVVAYVRALARHDVSQGRQLNALTRLLLGLLDSAADT